jgi:hypothetical protein
MSGKTVRVRLFALPRIRAAISRGRLSVPIGRLWNTRLDGLIVSGMEPGPGALREEPYWRMFTELIDWADRQTTSSIWSRLAAHAVVLHRDGIERRPLAAKCFGVYEFTKETDHPLLAGAPARALVPHSRWNDVPGMRWPAQATMSCSPVGGHVLKLPACSSSCRAMTDDPAAGVSGMSAVPHEREGYRCRGTIWMRRANGLGVRRRALSRAAERKVFRPPRSWAVREARLGLRLYRNWLSASPRATTARSTAVAMRQFLRPTRRTTRPRWARS